MAKIIKFRGPSRVYTVAVGHIREGGLLTVCSFRVEVYSREGFFEGGEGGNSRIYGIGCT